MDRPNPLDRSDRILHAIEETAVTISGVMMFLIMLIVVIDVALRYGLNSPLEWSYDVISLYLMVGLFFFALSHTLANNAHVTVDILHLYMPRQWRHAAEFIGYLCAAPVFLGIFYTSVISTWQAYQGNDVMAGHIAWPTWLASICVPLGTGLIFLRIVLRLIGHGISLVRRQSIIPLPPVSGSEETL